jgi:antirestriction protein ArdC
VQAGWSPLGLDPASPRCHHEFCKRFGDNAYAMEELVAKLGAVSLCDDLGIINSPRTDHAAYLSHWLTGLKADKKVIFTAASKAAQTVDHLDSLRPAIAKTNISDRELEGAA